jgi:hypothetical protein
MKMNMLESVKRYGLYTLLLGGALLTSCEEDVEAPDEENEVEVITDVTLIFTNTADATDEVTASAEDPDGAGVQELEIQDEITLTSGATYTLTYEILNGLDPSDVEDIGEEIEEEDDEHQFFYSFTDSAFSDPTGDGNVDDASDPINYEDSDDDGNPVGLETTWTAGDPLTGGTFTTILKHQPDVKTATSGSNDGETDFNLEFVLNIQ